MAILDQAPIVYTNLHHVNEQALFVLGIVIEHEHEPADGLGLAHPLAIMRHVLHRLVEAEETGVEPGPLEDAYPGQDTGSVWREKQAAEEVSPQVVGVIKFLVAIAIGRAKGIHRQRFGNASEDGQGFERTIIALLAKAPTVVCKICFLTGLKADRRS